HLHRPPPLAAQVGDGRPLPPELQILEIRRQRLLHPILGPAHVLISPWFSRCPLIFIVAAATICPTRCPVMGGSSSRPTAARLFPDTRTARKTMRSSSERIR